MSEAEGDRQQAFQYQNESYRVYPSNLQTIAWLGSHYIDLQVAEKAVVYYEKAVLANPNDPYFLLRIAGCFRRIGNAQKSLQMFQNIMRQFPENVDCFRALMHLTQTLGMTDLYQRYLGDFQRLEKLKETRQRIGSSRPTTTKSGTSNLGTARKRLSGRSSSQVSMGSDAINSGSSSGGGGHVEKEGVDSGLAYADPLGPAAERPRTGKLHSSFKEESDDDLDADEMLPM